MTAHFTKAIFVSILLSMSGMAHSATVTFSDITDGDGSAMRFDPATTVAAGNTLNIGINNFAANGSNPRRQRARNCHTCSASAK